MMMKSNYSFLEGKSVRLRALEPEDLTLLYQVENDPSIWNTSNATMPYSKFFLKQYLENQQGDIFTDKQLRLVIEHKEDRLPVGIIDLFEFCPLHQRVEVGVIVLEHVRSLGYGREAVQLIKDYAFNHLMMHQITAKVAVNNIPSLKMFKACNFKETASLKDWLFTSDGFIDILVLQCFK